MSDNNDLSRQLSPAQSSKHDADAGALDAVLRLPQGRHVVMWFLGLCDVYGVSFVSGEPDLTAFNLGRINVGKRVIAKLDEVDPEAYPRLLMSVAADRTAKATEGKVDVVDEADE